MNDNEHLATIQHLTEQLAEYQDAVRDAVQVLGHEGCEPVDLRDALGEIERLLTGHSDCERNDLQGMAEDVRALLWRQSRTAALLESARAQCLRRTSERDIARAALHKDDSAAGLISVLMYGDPPTPVAGWLLSQAVEHEDLLIGLVALRSTWARRDELHDWTACKQLMRERLVAAGQNADELFAGLEG